jgi:hypothetical protein
MEGFIPIGSETKHIKRLVCDVITILYQLYGLLRIELVHERVIEFCDLEPYAVSQIIISLELQKHETIT